MSTAANTSYSKDIRVSLGARGRDAPQTNATYCFRLICEGRDRHGSADRAAITSRSLRDAGGLIQQIATMVYPHAPCVSSSLTSACPLHCKKRIVESQDGRIVLASLLFSQSCGTRGTCQRILFQSRCADTAVLDFSVCKDTGQGNEEAWGFLSNSSQSEQHRDSTELDVMLFALFCDAQASTVLFSFCLGSGV